MKRDGQNKDDGHDNSGDVERHQCIGSDIPAGKDRSVGQFDEEDVDGAHGAQQQGLDGNGQPQEDGDSQVGEHAGEEDIVRQQAQPVSAGRLFTSALTRGRRCAGRLSLTGELRKKGVVDWRKAKFAHKTKNKTSFSTKDEQRWRYFITLFGGEMLKLICTNTNSSTNNS